MELRLLRCLIGVVVLLGASAAAAGGATKAPTVSTARNILLGEIIVGTGGRTVYDTTMDRAGKVACTGSCAARWLPLLIAPHRRPNAGSGVVASMLGTVQRPDGRWQVTYHGHPLYLFSGDARAGQANGEGLGGRWHALTPSGVIATSVAAAHPLRRQRHRPGDPPVAPDLPWGRAHRPERTSACGAPRTRSRASTASRCRAASDRTDRASRARTLCHPDGRTGAGRRYEGAETAGRRAEPRQPAQALRRIGRCDLRGPGRKRGQQGQAALPADLRG